VTAEITLTASTFEVAWEHAGLGEMPIVLYVPPAGFQEWERAEVVRRAWDELARAGLAHHGRLDAALVGLFELLAAPRRAVDARLALGRARSDADAAQGTGEVRGMAAANGESGVLARLADGTLTMRPISGNGLGREIITLLPEHPAGRGSSVSLARDQIDPAARAAGSSLYGFAERLIEAGVPGDQARTLVRMIDGTKRRGQFGAAVRDRDGRRHAARRAVAFHDTGNGRYLMVDRTTTDGRVWTTVTPATERLLAEHVQALLDGLMPG
jgi:EspG family